jgi:hypothetical protein
VTRGFNLPAPTVGHQSKEVKDKEKKERNYEETARRAHVTGDVGRLTVYSRINL